MRSVVVGTEQALKKQQIDSRPPATFICTIVAMRCAHSSKRSVNPATYGGEVHLRARGNWRGVAAGNNRSDRNEHSRLRRSSMLRRFDWRFISICPMEYETHGTVIRETTVHWWQLWQIWQFYLPRRSPNSYTIVLTLKNSNSYATPVITDTFNLSRYSSQILKFEVRNRGAISISF